MNIFFQLRALFKRIALTIVSAGVMLGSAQIQAAPFGDLLPFWGGWEENSAYTIDHSRWQALLDKYLDDQNPDGINRFDYKNISSDDRDRLNDYVEYLQTVEPRQLNSNEQKAYWINLYNAATALLIVEQGGDVRSIQQVRSSIFRRGPWQITIFKIVQQELSLDDVEHRIIRPIWRDNRIHYAVNCASLSCPNLLKTAFTGDNIEALLEQAASDYINHPRGVNIVDDELTLSSIYEWYADDFGASFADLKRHLVKYAKPELAAKLADFTEAKYEYDWALNGLDEQ